MLRLFIFLSSSGTFDDLSLLLVDKMARNILITGGSGYLGGSLLEHLSKLSDLPKHGTIYALVRSEDQASKVKQLYNFEPLELDLGSQDAMTDTLLAKDISIVFFLINAFSSEVPLRFLQALRKVKEKTGKQTHFVTTTGAKMFSSHAGHPTDRSLSDAEEDLFEIQKGAKAPVPEIGMVCIVMGTLLEGNAVLIEVQAIGSSVKVIEAAEAAGVRCYTFVPCIVYGEGTGFGNKTSIQTVAIIRAAVKLRRVYRVDHGRPVWTYEL